MVLNQSQAVMIRFKDQTRNKHDIVEGQPFDFYVTLVEYGETSTNVAMQTCRSWVPVKRVDQDMAFAAAKNAAKPPHVPGGRGLWPDAREYVKWVYGIAPDGGRVTCELYHDESILVQLPEFMSTKDDVRAFLLTVENMCDLSPGTICIPKVLNSFKMTALSNPYIPADPFDPKEPKAFPMVRLFFKRPSVYRKVIECLRNEKIKGRNVMYQVDVHEDRKKLNPGSTCMEELGIRPETWVTAPNPRRFQANSVTLDEYEFVADTLVPLKETNKYSDPYYRITCIDFEATNGSREERLDQIAKGVNPFPDADKGTNEGVQISIVTSEDPHKGCQGILLELDDGRIECEDGVVTTFRDIEYTTYYYRSERDMYEAMMDWVRFINPEMVVSFNGRGFDYPWMYRKMKQHSNRFMAGGRRIYQQPYQVYVREKKKSMSFYEAAGESGMKIPFAFTGRTCFDLYDYLSSQTTNFPEYTLNYFSGEWLGIRKAAFDGKKGDIPDAWHGIMNKERYNRIVCDTIPLHVLPQVLLHLVVDGKSFAVKQFQIDKHTFEGCLYFKDNHLYADMMTGDGQREVVHLQPSMFPKHVVADQLLGTTFEVKDMFEPNLVRMNNEWQAFLQRVMNDAGDVPAPLDGPLNREPSLAELRRELRNYCIFDSVLPIKIIQTKFMTELQATARLCLTMLNDVINEKKLRLLTAKHAEVAHQMGLCVSVALEELPQGSYPGGEVLDPQKGFYGGGDTSRPPLDPQPARSSKVCYDGVPEDELVSYPKDKNVGTLDFKSLYPNNMLAHNLCGSTYKPEHRVKSKSEHSHDAYLRIMKQPPLPAEPDLYAPTESDMRIHGPGVMHDAPNKDHYTTVVLFDKKKPEIAPTFVRFVTRWVGVTSRLLLEVLGERDMYKKLKSTYKGVKKQLKRIKPDENDDMDPTSINYKLEIGFDRLKELKYNVVTYVAEMRQLYAQKGQRWCYAAFQSAVDREFDLYDALQAARKLVANSRYGVMAYGKAPQPVSCVWAAVAICAIGRQMIIVSRDTLLRVFPHIVKTVIYGDTDSVMPVIMATSLQEAFEHLNTIAEYLTNVTFGFSPHIVMEGESVEENFLLVGKKRYSTIHYESLNDPPTIKTKGIQLVRSGDYPPVTTLLQQKAIDVKNACGCLSDQGRTHVAILELARHLYRVIVPPEDGGFDISAFTIRKGLGVTESKKPADHLRVAMKVRDLTGRPVLRNDQISYVYIKGHDVHSPEFVQHSDLDITRYLEDRIREVAGELFVLIGVDYNAVQAVFDLFLDEYNARHGGMSQFIQKKPRTLAQLLDIVQRYHSTPPRVCVKRKQKETQTEKKQRKRDELKKQPSLFGFYKKV